jgi:NAD(P)-dependent dehydrogenase (short-subunit alcohol dehydrogenase family)
VTVPEKGADVQMKDKVAVVTGAAQGNGKAIAERLAAEGAHVVCGDWNDEVLEKTVAGIRAGGGLAEAVNCDVTSPEETDAMLAVAERLGGPHAVVAQAGCSAEGTVEGTSPDEWDRIMAVDVKGTFLTVRASIPRMRKLGGGSIVTMSGTFAYFAEPGVVGHCTVKAAIRGFTRAVAVEYGDIGIRCNCIVPAYVDTPMVQQFYAARAPEVRREVESWHALNRIASPQEVANLALFLCSDESSFCTGQAYFVDGGLSCGVNSNMKPIGRQ